MSGFPRRALQAGGVVAAAALVLTGCLQNPNASGGGGAGGGGAGGFIDGGTADGDKVVTILGAFGGDEEKNFNASLADFEKSSGIKIQYTSDQDFTTTIKQKVAAGDSPDIGLFPQPGGMLEFASQKKVWPIDTYLDYDKLQSTLLPGFLDAARYKGRVYGAPMRNAVKSIVWYPKAAYTKGGYNTSPDTIQQLQTGVADKIAATGITPWCIGWGSDQATGWVGTDWVEELMLRMWGPDVYDQWTSHRIPFNDPRVVKAMDEAAKFNKDPKMVLGGTKGVLNTKFGDAMTPAFANPPKCLLHRQGNFATTFYPKNVQADLDNQVGIYVFPRFEGGYNGSGDPRRRRPRGPLQRHGPRRQEGHGLPHLRQVRRPVGQGRRLALTAQDVRRQQLPERHDAQDRGHRQQRRRAALRRLGPHAQGRRFGHLLDRDGQVGERAELPADG